ncbi:MAG: L,D-transpeptidase [Tissierellales bacterium]
MRKTIIISIILLFTLKSLVLSQSLSPQYKIEIDIISRSLYFYEDDNIVKEYPVAVGKASTQTPIGKYKVTNKVVNPYYAKKKIGGGSPQNPLGSRWMGFKPSYGVHGNSNPSSIGTFVSEGCIRMYDKDVKELYEKITIGTPVNIMYEPIKIKNDMDSKNPIIVVYPDTYKKVPNLEKLVDEKLVDLNLIEKISPNKLASLKKQLNRELVVFSDEWVYMINGEYITNDIIFMENAFYVNLDKVCSFFNIDIIDFEPTSTELFAGPIENANKVKTTELVGELNKRITVVKYNERKYVQISVLESTIGGKHIINQDQQVINLDISYILYNSRFVKGEVIDIEGEIGISLEGLSNIFYGGLNTSLEKASVSINGKEIGYRIVRDNPYIFLKDLLAQTDFKSNIYTKDKYIEIISDPIIFYDETMYKGIIRNRELFMTKELIIKLLNDYKLDTTDNCKCLTSLQGLLEENAEYYSINRLPTCYRGRQECCYTKFFLNKKVCP